MEGQVNRRGGKGLRGREVERIEVRERTKEKLSLNLRL